MIVVHMRTYKRYFSGCALLHIQFLSQTALRDICERAVVQYFDEIESDLEYRKHHPDADDSVWSWKNDAIAMEEVNNQTAGESSGSEYVLSVKMVLCDYFFQSCAC